jgi:nicotinamide-nucleotide amidase
MLEDQIIPRLLAKSGLQAAIFLKRFHSYGIGESHADTLLAGIEEIDADHSVKLGFRAHYPQLETKLTVRGKDMADVRRRLEPVEREVRRRFGNFILAEDDQTLERVVMDALIARGASLSIVEMFTSGQIAMRLVPLPGADAVVRRGVVSLALPQIAGGIGLPADGFADGVTRQSAEAAAEAVRAHTGSSHALAVLTDLDEGTDRIDFGASICLAIAAQEGTVSRRSRIVGGRDWVRLGAVELGLDCLRRYLQGLPIDERIDFEKIEAGVTTPSATVSRPAPP